MNKLHAPVPAGHLQAIGYVTVTFALLEMVISSFVWTWISRDMRLNEIFTSELSFGRLVGLLSSLFKYSIDDVDKNRELESFLKRALAAEQKRNIIVHSSWAAGDTPETITRMKTTAKMSKGLRYQFEQMSADDINAIGDEIAELAHDLQSFLFSFSVVESEAESGAASKS